MRHFALFLLLVPIYAQSGQSRRNLNWPCGATIDRSYLRISEGSGGHVLLFAPGEAEKSGVFLIAQSSHPQTVFRASGTAMTGPVEFSFPLESGIESIFLVGQAQCMERIQILRPNGAEVVHGNSAEITDYKAGRMIKLANPEPGSWRIRITGRGVFSAFALAKSPLLVALISDGQKASVRLPEDLRNPELALISEQGSDLSRLVPERKEDGYYEAAIQPPSVPYRIRMRAFDGVGNPVQRVHPNLYGIK